MPTEVEDNEYRVKKAREVMDALHREAMALDPESGEAKLLNRIVEDLFQALR